jgi:pimeloyl-ACP methyl ester carboxylesterase
VPEGKARLRVTLSALHPEQVRGLVEAIASARDRVDLADARRRAAAAACLCLSLLSFSHAYRSHRPGAGPGTDPWLGPAGRRVRAAGATPGRPVHPASVDLPGHGHSREDTTPLRLPFVVNAIAAATPPAVWCGWSLGGLFALHAAATLPKVRGLAMIAATPRFVRGDDWPHAVEPAVFEQFGRELATDFGGTLERFLALDVMGSAHAREELRTLRQRLVERGAPTERALLEGLRLLESTDLRGALPTLASPACGSPASVTGWCLRRQCRPPRHWPRVRRR